RVENRATPFTRECPPGKLLQVPVSHGEGNYYADPKTLQRLEDTGRVAFRYVDVAGEPTAEANPNGSANNIAGIFNDAGNVLGMMPHPERACDPLLGGEDGLDIFRSIVESSEKLLVG